MAKQRVPLYERLPEIYRIKDAEQDPPYQLKQYLGLVEYIFHEIHKDIEGLYHNLFIETCAEWVIPYIGDLLGVSHLKGDPWTLRADVADTIALRRRKGTRTAIELLTYNLTQWGVFSKELRENLMWSQHLNHQRPDAGGPGPYRDDQPETERPVVPRGGTLPLRDPGLLGLLNTPFDSFAHITDVKNVESGSLRYNLPNLGIFLWRLAAYTVPFIIPCHDHQYDYTDPGSQETLYGLCLHVHPLGEPVRLFNTSSVDYSSWPPVVSAVDEMPGPIHSDRLTSGTRYGCPEKYISIIPYNPADSSPVYPFFTGEPGSLPEYQTGVCLYVPESLFPGSQVQWSFRGADLKEWEQCLFKPLGKYEIALDPFSGRMIIPVESEEQKDSLLENLHISYTYGAVGPVGAHPVYRKEAAPDVIINILEDPSVTINSALAGIQERDAPLVIEIRDSLVHDLDCSGLDGTIVDQEGVCLQLKSPLVIRAAKYQRPVIRLVHPLRIKPTYVASGATNEGERIREQEIFNTWMERTFVRLEGLYITRAPQFPQGKELITRAAVSSLELVQCTLDPGGYLAVDGTRAPVLPGIGLDNHYGFTQPEEENAFNQVPKIIINQSVCGPLFIDNGYSLFLNHTILDGGKGVDDPLDNSEKDYALAAFIDKLTGWGPETVVNGLTVFGRMRVERLSGRGGIWVHSLEVFDNQHGCIKYSYFSPGVNRIPQWYASVFGSSTELHFTSTIFGNPAYGQLACSSDFAVRERGPGDDAMGAFGFLLEAHKWRNLRIRYREFMPVGIRPLLIPIT